MGRYEVVFRGGGAKIRDFFGPWNGRSVASSIWANLNWAPISDVGLQRNFSFPYFREKFWRKYTTWQKNLRNLVKNVQKLTNVNFFLVYFKQSKTCQNMWKNIEMTWDFAGFSQKYLFSLKFFSSCAYFREKNRGISVSQTFHEIFLFSKVRVAKWKNLLFLQKCNYFRKDVRESRKS